MTSLPTPLRDRTITPEPRDDNADAGEPGRTEAALSEPLPLPWEAHPDREPPSQIVAGGRTEVVDEDDPGAAGLRKELTFQREANQVLEGVLSAMRNRLEEAEAQSSELARLRRYAGEAIGPRAGRGGLAKAVFRALKHVFRARALIRRSLHILRGEGGVDTNWYRYRYPDVAKSGMDPALHYLLYGAYEGRDPNADFSTLAYVERHPEVWQSGLDPLSHSLRTDTAGLSASDRSLPE